MLISAGLLNCMQPDGMGACFCRPKAKTLATYVTRVLGSNKPDDDLLSHWLQHYHRREVVSRSCSGWEGVVPTCYSHQA